MDRDKLMKMAGAKAGAVRTGGKGSVRRKKKAVHKTTSTDDKRLQHTLKRLGVNTIPGIEEVNIFKDDSVIHFLNPKDMHDFLPNILSQLGPDNLANLRKMAAQMQAGGMGAAGDDEVPELVQNFDEVAE